MTEMPNLWLNRDECVGGYFLTTTPLPMTSLHTQIEAVDLPPEWLAAHDAEVARNAAANALRDAIVDIEYVLIQRGHLMTSNSRSGYYASRDILAARADRIEREATSETEDVDDEWRGDQC